ncbi:hypothetical protein APE02nite_21960 [Alkalibacterium pelagium]|uniref:Uncharacterized protein n=1 Tax=Alkalibacterium pelagium TaxID=426702 RepID=A0A1H7P354_9LACT|nr:hypothetical protein APE02nite_21960 [Alkalibacterium pelagium]SEL30056.1 hypothetical protein SAMN04488099_11721 [Alkalibacterium pelagium]
MKNDNVVSFSYVIGVDYSSENGIKGGCDTPRGLGAGELVARSFLEPTGEGASCRAGHKKHLRTNWRGSKPMSWSQEAS